MAGVVCSMAYGDQPALIAELTDWARMCGFSVVAAGKGTRYQPAYHTMTPDRVWETLRADARPSARGGDEQPDVHLVHGRH